ncbi:hypothetical protein IWQ60_002099 [Tieghemiomyces parasiticus]|uniref:F-box domain-containing protein n=1 Tax=Tieghemiomyces parasiticus TaxID=78921 RepID=A0A9W8E1X8_9FUNG|nr:hypothetical protein IWQ60_002099 [Tieghemiomyces parasiticus]
MRHAPIQSPGLVALLRLLPEADLQQLASYLGQRTCLDLCRVSRDLHTLFLPLALHTVHFNVATCPAPLALVATCRRHGRHIRRFAGTFSRPAGWPVRPGVAPTDIVPYLTRLDRLRLYWPHGVTPTLLRQWVAPLAGRLTHIDLRQDPTHHTAGLAIQVPVDLLHGIHRLAALTLVGFGTNDPRIWTALFQAHSHLTTLRLPRRAPDAALAAAARYLTDLVHLQIDALRTGPATLAAVAQGCPRLRRLTVTGLTPHNIPALIHLHPAHWVDLTHLSLAQDAWAFVEAASADPSPGPSHYQGLFATAWPRLRSLTLRHAPLDDPTLALLGRRCPRLRRLTLTVGDPPAVTDRGYRHLLAHAPHLTEFALEADVDPDRPTDLLPAHKLASSALRRLCLYLGRIYPSDLLILLPQLPHLRAVTLPRACRKADLNALRIRCPHLTITFG